MSELDFNGASVKLYNTVTMAYIRNKSVDYKLFSEFRSDIAWFIHNCKIMHVQIDFSIVDACNKLEIFVDCEISNAKDCNECYNIAFENDNGLTLPCSKKHKIVWAKSTGYCYYPAKLMREFDDGTVSVRYFDLTVDRLKADFVCDYSQSCPDRGSVLTIYTNALQVS